MVMIVTEKYHCHPNLKDGAVFAVVPECFSYSNNRRGEFKIYNLVGYSTFR